MKSIDIDKTINRLCEDHIELCPHCGAKAHLRLIHNDSFIDSVGNQHNYVTFRCVPCKKLCVKEYFSKQNPYSSVQNLEMGKWISKYPNSDSTPSQKFSEFVPGAVIDDYREGLMCMSVGAYRGAVSMFRRAIQDSMIDLGADQKADLIEQIQSIGTLTKDLKDWVHNVRIFGNWGAHPQRLAE